MVWWNHIYKIKNTANFCKEKCLCTYLFTKLFPQYLYYFAYLRANHLYFILQRDLDISVLCTFYHHFLYFQIFVFTEYRETGQQISNTLEIKFCEVLFCLSRYHFLFINWTASPVSTFCLFSDLIFRLHWPEIRLIRQT